MYGDVVVVYWFDVYMICCDCVVDECCCIFV